MKISYVFILNTLVLAGCASVQTQRNPAQIQTNTWEGVPSEFVDNFNLFEPGALKDMNNQAVLLSGQYSFKVLRQRTYLPIMTGVVTASSEKNEIGKQCSLELVSTDGLSPSVEIRSGEVSWFPVNMLDFYKAEGSLNFHASDDTLKISYEKKIKIKTNDNGSSYNSTDAKLTQSLVLERNNGSIVTASMKTQRSPSVAAVILHGREADKHEIKCAK